MLVAPVSALSGARGVVQTGAMNTVFDAMGGAPGLLRLAEAWHARVMVDEIVGHAFSHGFHPDHTERLAAYWAAWSRRTRRRILPDADFGIASTNVSFRTCL